MTDSKATLSAYEGEPLFIPCLVDGQPTPQVTWYRYRPTAHVVKQRLDTNIMLGDMAIVANAGLFVQKLNAGHGGRYSCHANNSLGKDSADTEVNVYGELRSKVGVGVTWLTLVGSLLAPLSAYLEPETQTVDIGKDVFLRCRVIGQPVSKVTWLKDGHQLTFSPRLTLVSQELLRISSVQRTDRGLYQCLAGNERESAQGVARLEIGGEVVVLNISNKVRNRVRVPPSH